MRAAALALVLVAAAPAAEARLLLSREEGMARIFGDSVRVETATLYLRQGTLDSLSERARSRFEQARITYYEVFLADTLAGLAFVDRHVVRTVTETVLIALRSDGSVRAVEILAWNEPEDYLPPRRWLETLSGVRDPSDVRPGKAVPRIAGATLSAQAMTASIRRALALGEQILLARTQASARGR